MNTRTLITLLCVLLTTATSSNLDLSSIDQSFLAEAKRLSQSLASSDSSEEESVTKEALKHRKRDDVFWDDYVTEKEQKRINAAMDANSDYTMCQVYQPLQQQTQEDYVEYI